MILREERIVTPLHYKIHYFVSFIRCCQLAYLNTRLSVEFRLSPSGIRASDEYVPLHTVYMPRIPYVGSSTCVSFSFRAIDQFISPSTALSFSLFCGVLPGGNGKRRKQNRLYVRGRVIRRMEGNGGKWRWGVVRAEEVAPERYPTIQEALYKQREEKEIPERRKKWRTRW